MECSLIQAALDWDCLSQETREEYQNHLRCCAACRNQISRVAPENLLFLLVEEERPQDFWLGFWDSLHPKLQRDPQSKMSTYLSLSRWAAVFCAAALLISFEHSTVREMSRIAPLELAPARESYHYPLVEDLNSPKATYYIFEPNENEKIVMILDPDMDL